MLEVSGPFGQGRPLIVLQEAGENADLVSSILDKLKGRMRVFNAELSRVSDQTYLRHLEALIAWLDQQQIRNAAFVGVGTAGIVAQALALKSLRTVRTLVLIDAATRPHPGRFTKFIDSIERYLPLGLPLRVTHSGFDSKPFLQRIRCPVLVVTTSRATPFLKAQCETLVHDLPTAFLYETSEVEFAEIDAIVDAIVTFQDIPAKCPQKNNLQKTEILEMKAI